VELFPKNTTGIVTARDNLVINQNKEDLLKKISVFCDESKTDQEIRDLFFGKKKEGKYKPGDSRGWKLELARKKIQHNDHELMVQPIEYRPFDIRYIYYSQDMVDWGRKDLMSHFINHENIGLIFARSQKDPNYSALFVSKYISETKCGEASTQSAIAPLYLYSTEGEKIPNINKNIWQEINKTVGETTPENVFDYVYAHLHSPSYRKEYKEFLKSDFPRVPFPKSKKQFWDLVPLGKKLRNLHLFTNSSILKPITTYSVSGSNEVEKVTYDNGNVYINETQFFGNVPEIAWKFYIGGYQPTQKYLKDRKGKTLTGNDIRHWQEIVACLVETDSVMQEIDALNIV